MKEITIPAEIGSISAAVDFVNEALEALECGIRAQTQIDVAMDEILSNVALYAYPGGSGEVTVRLDFAPETRMAVITFTDSGIPYDPLQKADPDVTLPAEERMVGGLGIFLVKKTMDAMEYERRDGMNVLTIRKAI